MYRWHSLRNAIAFSSILLPRPFFSRYCTSVTPACKASSTAWNKSLPGGIQFSSVTRYKRKLMFFIAVTCKGADDLSEKPPLMIPGNANTVSVRSEQVRDGRTSTPHSIILKNRFHHGRNIGSRHSVVFCHHAAWRRSPKPIDTQYPVFPSGIPRPA